MSFFHDKPAGRVLQKLEVVGQYELMLLLFFGNRVKEFSLSDRFRLFAALAVEIKRIAFHVLRPFEDFQFGVVAGLAGDRFRGLGENGPQGAAAIRLESDRRPGVSFADFFINFFELGAMIIFLFGQ